MPQWSSTVFAWCVALTCLAPLSAHAQGKPIYTNKPRFRIPYNFDPQEMQRLGAREIRLYVSLDQGLRWQPSQTVAPQPGKFNFQAQADGEYWFCVRTLDGRNQLHPDDKSVQPGLQVIVDTVQPRLNLSLKQIAAGRVRLSWTSQDEHLDASQLRLEYMQPGMPQWQPMSVVPKASDHTEWNVPQAGLVAVRGTISDLAGNVGQHETRLQVVGGTGRPGSTAPDFRDPVAGNDPGSGATAAVEPPANLAPQLTSPRGTAPADPATQWPTETPQSPRTTGPSSGFVSHQPGTNPNMIRQDFLREPAPAPAPFGGPSSSAPRDPSQRLVNQRQFHIGYRIDEVGPSGVGGVELFITPDQGRSWYRYGEDPDRQSPMLVAVPKEGTYGFTLIVRSGVGVAADPPQPGERPAFLITVDETAPQVQLQVPEQGRGPNLNKVLLRWMTQDDQLSDRPVSLWYSAQPQGPWQPLAAGLENTGSHVWTMSPGVPMRVYFRIEVRDAAGNVQRVDTNEPMLIDLARPSARIIDVETTATQSNSGFMPQ